MKMGEVLMEKLKTLGVLYTPLLPVESKEIWYRDLNFYQLEAF